MSNNYLIILSNNTEKIISKFDKPLRERISKAIKGLSKNPYPIGSKKLIATDNQYRIRVGDYRIIYTVKAAIITIYILSIGHRKEIYRKS